jgi:PAS domain S-box-containing protein
MKIVTKTSLLLIMVILVVVGGIGTFHLHVVEEALRTSVFAGLQGISQTAATHTAGWIEECLMDTQAVAFNLPREALMKRDTEAVEEYLGAMNALFPKFDNGFFILDADGRLWVDYPVQPATRGKDLSFREYYQRTKTEGRGIVGVPYRSVRTGEPVVTFTAYLKGPSGETMGLLGASARLLAPSALGGIRGQKIGSSGYIYIYDRSRLMILHPEQARLLQRDVPPGVNKLFDAAIDGFEGVGETINSRGIPMLLSLSRVVGTDWILGAQQASSEAFAAVARMRGRLMVGMVLGALIALLLGIVAVRRITRPLTRLHQTALQLQERFLSNPAGKKTSPNGHPQPLTAYLWGGEIGDLFKTLQDFSDSLDDTMNSLRESERRYRKVFEMAQDAIFLMDRQGQFVDANKAAERLFRCTRRTLLLNHPARLSPERQPDGTLSTLAAHEFINRAFQGEPQRFEWLHMTPDGEPFYAEVALGVVSLAGEQSLLAVARDISNQKQDQALLRQEWEQLNAVLDGSPIPTFLVDQEGKVVLWNRSCESTTSIPRHEVLGRPLDLSPLFGDRNLPVPAEILLKMSDDEIIMQLGTKNNMRFDPVQGTLETKGYITVNGKRLTVQTIATRIRDTGGNLLGAVQCAQDFTREEELQRQLLHASKMETIGTMAGGMAHEFNNILAAIQGRAQLALMILDRESSGSPDTHNASITNHLSQIERSCQRAAALTHNMLAFARSDPSKISAVSIKPLMERLYQMLTQTLPPEITIKMDLEEHLPILSADANQIEQAVVNLVLNARDAMPGGGEIVIGSRVREARHEARNALGKPGCTTGLPFVEIEVSDTGTGIPEQIRDQIFDPFFTTKEPGKGTGLGLSIVFSIAKGHGGHIHVESNPGGGSRFLLSFPLSGDNAHQSAEHAGMGGNALPCGNQESLLIIDDEEMVREVMREVLKSHGYQVSCAANGQEGLHLYREAMDAGNPFQLVLLDLAMPVMGGKQCLDHLTSLDPTAKVLLASGLVDGDVQESDLLQKASGILRKPYLARDLLREVRRHLDAP